MAEEKYSFVVLYEGTGEPAFVMQGDTEITKVVEAIVARTSFEFVLDKKHLPRVANGPWFVKGGPDTIGHDKVFFRIYCIVPTIQI